MKKKKTQKQNNVGVVAMTKVKIKTTEGPREVEAMESDGQWALHKAVNRESKYTITHIKSGLALPYVEQLNMISMRRLFRKLSEAEIPEPKNNRRMTLKAWGEKNIAPIIMEVLKDEQPL